MRFVSTSSGETAGFRVCLRLSHYQSDFLHLLPVCLRPAFFLILGAERNQCANLCLEQCKLVHFNLPYKWEVNDGNGWRDLRGMEAIERAFCDPRNICGLVNTHRALVYNGRSDSLIDLYRILCLLVQSRLKAGGFPDNEQVWAPSAPSVYSLIHH